MRLVNQKLGLDLQPGDFNEQLLISGLGTLGWVGIGAILTFAGSSVQLEVVDYAYPCQQLAEYAGDSRIIKFLIDDRKRNMTGKPYSRRGILARVLSSGVLKPGLTISVKSPSAAR